MNYFEVFSKASHYLLLLPPPPYPADDPPPLKQFNPSIVNIGAFPTP